MMWTAFWLSIRITAVATAALMVLGVPLGWALARLQFRGRMFVETLLNLPLVLPPSVVGYYLLRALGRGSPLVAWLNLDILFTWQAAAVASTVVALPLMVQSVQAAIADVDPALENAARTLGVNEVEIFWHITLPLARRGILAGVLLGGARALGEFGATLMVAGNIPGRTQTLPLAIYDAVQNRQYDLANQMVLLMTALAFLALWGVRRVEMSRHAA
ncbi:molybdate transport system permease protein [Ardenticatena maritima]|uniref:Molybdenum transport system permease n=1 Tax=Ardenticatena maritima TaxID=872965 RepID=A0A0M8K7N7_9CHLR|nr:ABC transporter permease [Ardenticatena maritima]GAP63445.1 molybdate transport system permease protein [Ardenticatena maritima]